MSLLDDARKRINAIDEEMAKLFEQRMQAVEDVIRYKQAHQMNDFEYIKRTVCY